MFKYTKEEFFKELEKVNKPRTGGFAEYIERMRRAEPRQTQTTEGVEARQRPLTRPRG